MDEDRSRSEICYFETLKNSPIDTATDSGVISYALLHVRRCLHIAIGVGVAIY